MLRTHSWNSLIGRVCGMHQNSKSDRGDRLWVCTVFAAPHGRPTGITLPVILNWRILYPLVIGLIYAFAAAGVIPQINNALNMKPTNQTRLEPFKLTQLATHDPALMKPTALIPASVRPHAHPFRTKTACAHLARRKISTMIRFVKTSEQLMTPIPIRQSSSLITSLGEGNGQKLEIACCLVCLLFRSVLCLLISFALCVLCCRLWLVCLFIVIL